MVVVDGEVDRLRACNGADFIEVLAVWQERKRISKDNPLESRWWYHLLKYISLERNSAGETPIKISVLCILSLTFLSKGSVREAVRWCYGLNYVPLPPSNAEVLTPST